MLTGDRAFNGNSPADTISAILTKEPPDLSTGGAAISPALGRIVRHCLEKAPDQRFQDARDVVFALREVDGQTLAAPLRAAAPRARANDMGHHRSGPVGDCRTAWLPAPGDASRRGESDPAETGGHAGRNGGEHRRERPC